MYQYAKSSLKLKLRLRILTYRNPFQNIIIIYWLSFTKTKNASTISFLWPRCHAKVSAYTSFSLEVRHFERVWYSCFHISVSLCVENVWYRSCRESDGTYSKSNLNSPHSKFTLQFRPMPSLTTPQPNDSSSIRLPNHPIQSPATPVADVSSEGM